MEVRRFAAITLMIAVFTLVLTTIAIGSPAEAAYTQACSGGNTGTAGVGKTGSTQRTTSAESKVMWDFGECSTWLGFPGTGGVWMRLAHCSNNDNFTVGYWFNGDVGLKDVGINIITGTCFRLQWYPSTPSANRSFNGHVLWG